jgi:2-polyprenyl-3-methyl-5-hydroxy-6-metoxy-1,4-benzoquinol methylase
MSGPEMPCPACGSTDFVPHLQVSPAEIWRCTGCGLGVTIPHPAEANGQEAFRNDLSYFASAYEQRKDHWWHRFASAPFGLLTKVGAMPGQRLLDLGCNLGSFVQLAQARGFDASGLDASPAAVAFGRQHLGVNLACGRIESAVVEPGSLDIVVASHVLEHLPDPVALLRRAREWLRPSGWLLVSVPNFASPIARWSHERWAGLVPTQHIWHFTPQALRRLTAHAGFGSSLWTTRMLTYGPGSLAEWAKWGIRRLLEPLRLADNLLLATQRPGRQSRA